MSMMNPFSVVSDVAIKLDYMILIMVMVMVVVVVDP